MSEAISYQDWSDFLLRIGAICEPAELHGMTIGYLCSNQNAEPYKPWLRQAVGFMDLIAEDANEEVDASLISFCQLCHTTLAGEDYQLQLLLPDDALPLNERALALAKWCQGFLHGLALAGEQLGDVLGDDAKESLQDIVNIAQVSHDTEESSEEDFVQIIEYIRVAVFQLYTELHTDKGGSNNATVH